MIGQTGVAHTFCGTFDLEPECGRPKGMKVGPDGKLYIVDAYKGLLRMDLMTFALDILIPSEEGTKFILLINVKMQTIVGILTFISMINTTSERRKAKTSVFVGIFVFMSS